MMLGARIGAWAPSGGVSAQSYAMDGLIIQYDAIENEGYGLPQNKSATVWKNLRGDSTRDLACVGTYEWTDRAFSVSQGQAWYTNTGNNPDCSTVKTLSAVIWCPEFVANAPIRLFYANVGRPPYTHICYKNNSTAEGNIFLVTGNNCGEFAVANMARFYNTFISVTVVFVEGNKRVYINGIAQENYAGYGWDRSGADYAKAVGGFDTQWYVGNNGRIAAICSERVYTRELTTDEILHDYAVDAERFGLT